VKEVENPLIFGEDGQYEVGRFFGTQCILHRPVDNGHLPEVLVTLMRASLQQQKYTDVLGD